ncbi:hypothetical protein ACFFU9_12665 [Mariniflexile ostreae]|uniref:N-acetyltransferase domain-containing protein n=1 Tax=Mariniflexile ostreae TaxID=1520892 RepID=A0ABV5FEQ7_9FLAO
MKNKIKVFFSLLTHGDITVIFKIIKNRIYSNTSYYFFRRDLNRGITYIPEAKIEVSIRPYRDSDYEHFKGLPLDDMLLNANIPTCYVAVTQDGTPCFREWFIEPSQNEKIKSFFGHNFPSLEEDECIFERAYAVERYRGMNIYSVVNYHLGKKALELGYRWAVSCIEISNIESLKGAIKLEARPHKLQVTKWRFFVRRTVYVEIPKKLKAKNPWLFD